MPEPILVVRSLRKAFGGHVATDQVDLDVRPNEIHALIGPNGAGKSTLIGQIVGDLRPDAGSIQWIGEDIVEVPAHLRARRGLVRSFQISSVLPEMSALDNVRLSAFGRKLPKLSYWSRADRDAEIENEALRALDKVGLRHRASEEAGTLSYGERRHLELAMALTLRPRLMLLDEPMAGVGPEESRALTKLLDGLRESCAILLVEHDMDVVFALADRVSVLVAGAVIASGKPTDVREDAAVQSAYFGTEDIA